MAHEDRLEKMLRALGVKTLTRHTLPEHEKAALRGALNDETQALARVAVWDIPSEKQAALAAILDAGKAGMIREDLLLDLLIFLFPPRSQEELIELFKGYMTQDELVMLRNAVAVDRLMAIDRDRARGLLSSSERKFGPDARKMYNLYSAGFIAKLCVFERTMLIVQDERSAPRLFHEWFRRKLDFFEKAIFVNDLTTGEEIKAELRRRMNPPASQSSVEIWGAGVNIINRVHSYLEEFVGDRKTWDFNISLRRYGDGWGATFVVYDVRKLPTFKPTRLERFWEFSE